VALLGTIAAGVGIALGYLMYRDRKERDPLVGVLGPMWNVLQHRYYVDAFYMRAIIYPIRDQLSAGVDWTNRYILDGVVNGAAMLGRGFGVVINWIDRNVVDGFVNATGEGANASGGFLRSLQTGNVQWYAVLLFVGVLALTIVFVRIA
jgi:NADH-quinone oxidoreductase subunit L